MTLIKNKHFGPTFKTQIQDPMKKRVVLKIMKLSEHPDISRKEIADISGYSIAQCTRILNLLRKDRLIRISGRAKIGRTIMYKLVDK